MSRHPQIEEIADDPDDFDIADYEPAPRGGFQGGNQSLVDPRELEQFMNAQRAASGGDAGIQYIKDTDSQQYKHFQTLYPCYWDKKRSLKEGRRVPKEQAVDNPLAFSLVQACQSLGLKTVFEPTKTHPQDWANMGRVKVAFKVEGFPKTHQISSKREMYKLIGEYLQAHPTTEASPALFRIPNMPYDPSKPPPPIAVPKGWTMGTILPLHSPAISGGGVSDNFLKDMMAEMGQGGAGGGGGGGMPDMATMAKMMSSMGGMGGMGGLGGLGGMEGLGDMMGGMAGAPGGAGPSAKKEKPKKIKR